MEKGEGVEGGPIFWGGKFLGGFTRAPSPLYPPQPMCARKMSTNEKGAPYFCRHFLRQLFIFRPGSTGVRQPGRCDAFMRVGAWRWAYPGQ